MPASLHPWRPRSCQLPWKMVTLCFWSTMSPRSSALSLWHRWYGCGSLFGGGWSTPLDMTMVWTLAATRMGLANFNSGMCYRMGMGTSAIRSRSRATNWTFTRCYLWDIVQMPWYVSYFPNFLQSGPNNNNLSCRWILGVHHTTLGVEKWWVWAMH